MTTLKRSKREREFSTFLRETTLSWFMLLILFNDTFSSLSRKLRKIPRWKEQFVFNGTFKKRKKNQLIEEKIDFSK